MCLCSVLALASTNHNWTDDLKTGILSECALLLLDQRQANRQQKQKGKRERKETHFFLVRLTCLTLDFFSFWLDGWRDRSYFFGGRKELPDFSLEFSFPMSPYALSLFLPVWFNQMSATVHQQPSVPFAESELWQNSLFVCLFVCLWQSYYDTVLFGWYWLLMWGWLSMSHDPSASVFQVLGNGRLWACPVHSVSQQLSLDGSERTCLISSKRSHTGCGWVQLPCKHTDLVFSSHL